jgi:hypothetical protein
LACEDAQEVNGSVDAPDSGDAESEQWFLESSQVEDGTDQVKAMQVRLARRPKPWNEQMQDHIVVGPLVEGHDAQEATERVEDEGAEVGGEGDNASIELGRAASWSWVV